MSVYKVNTVEGCSLGSATSKIYPQTGVTGLNIYCNGNKQGPTILFTNPVGMPYTLAKDIFTPLLDQYYVITWDGRALLTAEPEVPEENLNAEYFSVQNHLNDLQSVIDTQGRDIDHLMSFCSGSYVALYALQQGQVKPKSYTMISSPIECASQSLKTDFQTGLMDILPRITQSGIGFANIVHKLVSKGSRSTFPGLAPHLLEINNQPFSSAKHILIYAFLHSAWLTQDWHEILFDVDTPVHNVHGENDSVAHIDGAKQISKCLSNVRNAFYPGMEHFLAHSNHRVIEDVVDFIRHHD